MLDSLKPAIYAFVKKNPRIRNAAMAVLGVFMKTKDFAIRVITRAETFGPPIGIIDYKSDFKNNIGTGNLACVTAFTEVSEPISVSRDLPVTIDKIPHWNFRQKQSVTDPATYVMELKDCRVYDDGIVITPDNLMLGSVSQFIEVGEYIKDLTQHPIFSKKELPPLKKVKGTIAVLSAPSGRGYYHWMFDVLPRIQLLRNAGYDFNKIDKFLVNNYISRFHIETLNMIGIPRNKIMESQYNPHIQAEKLIVPSLVGDTGSIPKYACDFLRAEFLPKIDRNKNHSKRIYVNRGQVVHRRVTNEPQIVELLQQYGFESIALETMSLLEQIAVMATAEVIIAPHGAGLTNIVFSEPGTTIIEFLHPGAVNVMYWTIAADMGYKYHYLLSEGDAPPDFVNPYLNGNDMTISIDKLKDLLALAAIN
ncbi:glycosyltransferase family 61 protein [Mucilaginibacter sp.]|jgi:capsular polysaccharide biosynthesis protein|uniref:glycosyltransferase family 61 protein n=1 Tax=Mucilaginibacter sp. TaxID=1882438 RepID=UPI002CF645A1|nr:glycosyltransferase family 61 protein [Mucilaginibacter sp.]HTI61595.1 glycosyltransferase family 61 protein [Mucilaginibacter sp.]